jgi:predicted RNA-binding protein with RPS1 domain
VSHLVVGGRVNDPNDIVKRSQAVKVKVLSVAGTRISLSLKEVDQNTGADLAPRSTRTDDVGRAPVAPRSRALGYQHSHAAARDTP